MNVNSIDSTSATYSPTNQRPAATDFKALAQALQSGDLNRAQQAFASLQQDAPWVGRALSASSAIAPAGGSSAVTALQDLRSALQSGDLSGAQQAFANLQQSAHAGHHAHHHHASTTSASANPQQPAPQDSGSGSTSTTIDTIA